MTTILVMEDEPTLRQNIAEFLSIEGYDVLQAEDGQVGLNLARERVPELIISDISMPVLDGYEVLLQLRQNPAYSSIPFIFLTAMTDRSFVRHGMELGADDYLTKPFTYPELIAAVNTRLERHKEHVRVATTELDAVKKRLSRVVTHEMRSPVASILMVQNLLSAQLDTMETHEIRAILDTLQAGSFRIYHLAEQLSFMTQLDTDTLNYDAIVSWGFESPIWSILMAATNLGRRFAHRNPNGTLQLDERDRDAVILCHNQSLTHALAEVIANALDFSPPGCDVFLSQWQRDQSVFIRVTDYGPGMTEEQLERAQQEFEQIDRDTKEQQGLGLGLHVARRVIEAHHGKLDIVSRSGAGTQVTIELPLHRSA